MLALQGCLLTQQWRESRWLDEKQHLHPCSPATLPRKLSALTLPYLRRNMSNEVYSPRVVARLGAASPVECLSEYSQIVDGNYFLPLSSDDGVLEAQDIADFPACVDLCSLHQCQIVTFDYMTRTCFVRMSLAPVLEG